MAKRTAMEVYSMQNKIINMAFSSLGMAYGSNKSYWLDLFKEISGRKVKGLSELTLSERDDLILHFNSRGEFSGKKKLFRPYVIGEMKRWKKGDSDIGSSQRPMGVSGDKSGYISKIGAILADMKLPWRYVDGIALKTFGVEKVEWCDEGDLRKITQMMVYHQKRSE